VGQNQHCWNKNVIIIGWSGQIMYSSAPFSGPQHLARHSYVDTASGVKICFTWYVVCLKTFIFSSCWDPYDSLVLRGMCGKSAMLLMGEGVCKVARHLFICCSKFYVCCVTKNSWLYWEQCLRHYCVSKLDYSWKVTGDKWSPGLEQKFRRLALVDHHTNQG